MQLPAEVANWIMESSEMPIPMQIVLSVSTHYLKSIIEQVKNCLMDYQIRSNGDFGRGYAIQSGGNKYGKRNTAADQ